MEKIIVTQNTDFPYLSGIIYQGDPRKKMPVNFTGWTGKIYINSLKGDVLVDGGSIEWTNSYIGAWQYKWESSDTKYAGQYKAILKLTSGEGKVATVPSDGHFVVQIISDISGTPRRIECDVYVDHIVTDGEIL